MGALLAIIAVAFLGVWYCALWRVWRDASRDQTRAERRLVLSALAVLVLLPIALAVVGASDGTAKVAIAIAVAVVLPVLFIIGARDDLRRQRRLRARGHGTSDRSE